MEKRGRGRPVKVAWIGRSLVEPEIYDIRDQPSFSATEIYLRDMRLTGVIHAHYVNSRQDVIDLWEVFAKGELIRRSFTYLDLGPCMERHGLALPLVLAQ